MNQEQLLLISKLSYEQYLNSAEEESFESLFEQRLQMAAQILRQADVAKNQTETIKGQREEIRRLEKRDQELTRLEENGVDNWGGY